VPSESLTATAPTPRDATEERHAVTVHAHLTALPGLLAEAELAEAHVEARDRRTGTLVAYSFATIHRALALHVAEAVRIGLARLGIEANPEESNRDARRTLDDATGAVSPSSPDVRPGQYL
jgi:hypothetical protein